MNAINSNGKGGKIYKKFMNRVSICAERNGVYEKWICLYVYVELKAEEW